MSNGIKKVYNNLRISIDKCEFFRKEINFLEFEITKEGIKPTQEKSAAILSYPEPTESKALRRFIGIAGYYRHLIPILLQFYYL